LSRGVSQAIRWAHLSDRKANGRMNPRTIVYLSGLVEFTRRLRNSNTRISNEMASFYDDIEIGCQVRETDFQPQFVDFDSAQCQPEDCRLSANVSSWMNLAEHATLAVYMIICEDRPDWSGRNMERSSRTCIPLISHRFLKLASRLSRLKNFDVELRLRGGTVSGMTCQDTSAGNDRDS
jgi:hypothetical protein